MRRRQTTWRPSSTSPTSSGTVRLSWPPCTTSFRSLSRTTSFSSEYQTKQAHSHPDQSGALVNVDVLDTVLLSLHPKSKLKSLSLSDYTREGLAEMEQFQDLIHMDIHKGYDGYGRRLVTLIPSKAPKLPKQLCISQV